MTEPLG